MIDYADGSHDVCRTGNRRTRHSQLSEFAGIAMTLQERIERFLNGDRYAVVGASQDRAKYGNKVLRCYLQNQRIAVPVNPKVDQIEGQDAFAELAAIPEPVHGVSIITPPTITRQVVQQAAALGIRHLWMQPGAEDATAVDWARQQGLEVIAGDACLLVVLGYHESSD
jgi:predicted CoA-binding protein